MRIKILREENVPDGATGVQWIFGVKLTNDSDPTKILITINQDVGPRYNSIVAMSSNEGNPNAMRELYQNGISVGRSTPDKTRQTIAIVTGALMFAPDGTAVGAGQSTFWSSDGSGEKLAGFEWHGAYKVNENIRISTIAISQDGLSTVHLQNSRLFWVDREPQL